jgi:hypothetical protein
MCGRLLLEMPLCAVHASYNIEPFSLRATAEKQSFLPGRSHDMFTLPRNSVPADHE